MHATETHTLFVIACAAPKCDALAPAAELYTSPNFRLQLAAARAEAEATERDLGTPARVMILSALHGLVELDQILAPYDVKMGGAGQVSTADLARQLGRLAPRTVVSMLPNAYRDALTTAARWVREVEDHDIEVLDAYEYSPGIGFQRGTASSLIRGSSDLLGTN